MYNENHEAFRESFNTFVEREIVPFNDEWEQAGKIDKAMFRQAGELGYLGMRVDEKYGGLGLRDYRYSAIVCEVLQHHGMIGSGMCMTLHNDIAIPYIEDSGTEEQRERWLPGMVSGELMGAISMTEPGAGSDLAGIRTLAKRDGDNYIVNGSKTFVTNGINSDIAILAVTVDPALRHKGLTLLVVEKGTPGFTLGAPLDKIGLKSQDTTEFFFDDVRIPVANRLGEEGDGFGILMQNLAQERLQVAVSATAAARACLEWTVAYCRERTMFGGRLSEIQNTKFELADMVTRVEVTEAYVREIVMRHVEGKLTSEDAAKGKWWASELQNEVNARCLQLHGGYGFMREYPVARAYLDARIQTIYAGTNEVMKEIIGRDIDRNGFSK